MFLQGREKAPGRKQECGPQGWICHDAEYYVNDAGVRAYPIMLTVKVHRLCIGKEAVTDTSIENNFQLLSGIPETLRAKK